MNIVKEQPPNIDKIREVLNPPETACFAYGDTLYNPSGNEIYLDVMAHEKTHEVQQRELGPEKWWDLYLSNADFRRDCEVEAYANQYKVVKERRPAKISKKYLELFAHQLSTLYKLDMDFDKALTIIRLKAKK